MAKPDPLSLPDLFATMVFLDLKHAGCRPTQLEAVVNATLGTMHAFLRANWRESLLKGLSAKQALASQANFETSLRRAVAKRLPKPGQRGRKKDYLGNLEKLIRILVLKSEQKSYPEIERSLREVYGRSTADAYRKLWDQYSPDMCTAAIYALLRKR